MRPALSLVMLGISLIAAGAAAAEAPSLRDIRAQNLQVTLLDGRSAPLNDLLGTGHPVVIEFWATWCSPCRKTMPNLRRLHNQYQQRGLVVIGLTVEEPSEDLEKVKTFVEKEQVPYRVAFATDEVFKAITKRSRVGVPKILVYDSTGAIARYEVSYSPLTNGRVSKAVDKAMTGSR